MKHCFDMDFLPTLIMRKNSIESIEIHDKTLIFLLINANKLENLKKFFEKQKRK